MPAIARLLYYGGIQLCGPPVPHAATHRHCSALLPGGRPFQRVHPHPQRVTDPLLPGGPHRIIDIRGGGRAVSAPLPRVSPHPLRGPRAAWRAVLPQGCRTPVAASRLRPQQITRNKPNLLDLLGPPSNEESPWKRLNLKLILKETRAGSSAWKSARLATERSRVQVPAGPPPSLPAPLCNVF